MTRSIDPYPPPCATTMGGRETGRVGELHPPLPPPDGSPQSGPTAPRADQGWDADRIRDLAEAWFRPLTRPEGWLALLYVGAGGVLAPLFFAAMVVVAAVAFGLSFALVGLLLIVPTFKMVERFVRIEQRLAALADQHFELRSPMPIRGITSILTVLRDPVRWRQVGFVAVNLVVGPAILALGAFPVSLVIDAVFGDGIIDGPGFSIGIGILALPVVLLAAGAIPRFAIWFADVKAQFDTWFLGTSRLAAAEQRVSALSTQRQDILDAVAGERRRIERNLHDGVQQQLVAIGLDLGMAEQQLERDPERARELLGNARHKVQGSIGELRQLGRGLHPAILADRGLDAALSAVVAGAPIPISVQVDPDLDLSTDVAETVYFVANEAIANVLKHARARVASVHVAKIAANVRVTVHDDGVGGASPAHGTGIAGIRARVNAVDGALTITSPSGGPTTLVAEIPRHAPEREVRDD